MIALDQLIKYHEEFSKIYKLMGLNVNLNSIINLENKRKEFQLEYENLRATSNKLCSKMSSLKKQNKNVLGELEKIKKINKEIKTLENKLKYYERKINLKLKHLHNIPDFCNEFNEQIDTDKNQSSLTEFSSFIKSMMPSKHSLKSVKTCLKMLKNRVFNEDELPICTFARNSIVILVTDTEVDSLIQKFMDYFIKNCKTIVKVSIKNLEKSSCFELLVQLNKTKYLKFKVKREFLTREYKIKYKNNSLDMTKFVNQINIKYL